MKLIRLTSSSTVLMVLLSCWFKTVSSVSKLKFMFWVGFQHMFYNIWFMVSYLSLISAMSPFMMCFEILVRFYNVKFIKNTLDFIYVAHVNIPLLLFIWISLFRVLTLLLCVLNGTGVIWPNVVCSNVRSVNCSKNL